MQSNSTPVVMVYTGNGKGKTCAAMGQMVRAIGHGAKCAVIQFIKCNPVEGQVGEYACATQRLGVTWKNYGLGFTWEQENLDATREECRKGWEQFKRWVSVGTFDMIVLDEFTYALAPNMLDVQEICTWIADHRGKEGFPHTVITGRNAPKELVDVADVVSEVVEVKHHLALTGKKAAAMIEF